MFDITNYITHGNYIEIILEDHKDIVDINEKIFFKILQNVRNKGYNGFQKHCKEYVYRNITYENNNENQIKVYKKILNKQDSLPSGHRILVFHKDKLPYHTFPSTTMIQSVCYISKAIFKINNRIFLNFERKIYEGSENVFFNKIYINYNHDDNVDSTTMQHAISTALDLISWT